MKIKHYLCSFILISLFSTASQAALPATDANGNVLPTLAPMLQKIDSAVVNIATSSTRQVRQNPLMNDPYFKRFFDSQQPQRSQRQNISAGSGVIVDASKGIVMTNHHVINNADDIKVSLIDGRSFTARLLGSDPDLDIAILQIDANNLQEVKLADSSRVQVGDFAVAIGNPFGLGQTVTTGIVSALSRSGLGLKGYENYIQTDASINPGNSGGALVDLSGRLIGINSAIIAPAGGNVGIGFAIPVNMAKASMQQILRHGEVRRGQIGVSIQDITDELRQAFNLRNGQQGVLITGVGNNTPAKKAGIQSGDIIIAVDNKSTHSSSQLRSQIGIKNINDRVQLKVLRNGHQRAFNVAVGNPQQFSQAPNQSQPSTTDLDTRLSGATFKTNLNNKGIFVSSISANSAAAHNGLAAGDVITKVNKRTVRNIKDFERALKSNNRGLFIQVSRNNQKILLAIR
jgi:Do/DeqQ family serine protease